MSHACAEYAEGGAVFTGGAVIRVELQRAV